MADLVARYPTIEIKLKVESLVSMLEQIRSGDQDLLLISEPAGVGAAKEIC